MIVGLFGLVVIAGVVMLIVRVLSHRPPAATTSTAGDAAGLRRFFQYVLLFGLTVVSAVGVAGLLTRLFGAGDSLVRADTAQLARSLTFTVVGIPALLGVARWSQRRLAADPGESRSLGWAFFLSAASIVALVTAMVAAFGLLVWAVGDGRYDGGDLARLLVWAGVWAGVWTVGRRIPPVDEGRVHLLVGSAIGLVAAAGGLGVVLAAALESLYVAIGGAQMIAGEVPLAEGVATLVVGAVPWTWYWLRHALHMPRTPLWHAFVLLLGVGGGLTVAVVAGSTIVYDLLVWLLGDPNTASAGRHFDSLPQALAALGVGLLAWWYHRTVLHSAEVTARGDIDRLYEYLVAAVGLLAAAGGLTTVLVALGEALTTGAVVEAGSAPVNTLMAALTLLVVGAPVWWVFWHRIGAAMEAQPVEEAHSPVRRVYLFALFGVVGVVAVIALLVAVFFVFEDLIAGALGSETVRRARVPFGLLVTAGVVAGYHWTVFRSDRELAPAPPPPTKHLRLVVLVGIPDPAVGTAVARATGSQVWQWKREPGDGWASWSTEAIVAALDDVTTPEAILLATPDGFDVIPVDRT